VKERLLLTVQYRKKRFHVPQIKIHMNPSSLRAISHG
jgi:hypothetical protein